MMLNIAWYDPTDITCFPHPEQATKDPDGLLAMGGNLSKKTLVTAYSNGIFPWFSDGQPIMWWSPSLRAVFKPDTIHISKSLNKLIKQSRYKVTADQAFTKVIEACSAVSDVTPRCETWITAEMKQAYQRLHQAGIAHSIEVWNKKQQLVGGLYGVMIKNCFCGESMFFRENNTSKLALVFLGRFLHNVGVEWIDCQIPSPHLSGLGAITINRADFLSRLQKMRENTTLKQRTWGKLWQHYWG